MPGLQRVLISFKREYWENKSSIVYVPAMLALILSAALFLGITVGQFSMEDMDLKTIITEIERDMADDGDSINIEGTITIDDEEFDPEKFKRAISQYEQVTNFVLIVVSLLFFAVSIIVSTFYALYALYDDRKDRSILFWKSLPVTETESVVVKFLVCILVIPVVALIISMVAQFAYSIGVGYFFSKTGMATFFDIVVSANYLSILFSNLELLFYLNIVLLPLTTYLFAVSAFSKKSPFLLAWLPPLTLVLVEKIIFGSNYVLDFLDRIFNLGGINFDLNFEDGVLDYNVGYFVDSMTQLITGFIASVVFFIAAIWLRNNRYEI